MKEARDEVAALRGENVSPPRYCTNLPFGYKGKERGRGEIVEFGGQPNDATLLGRNYIRLVRADETPMQCGGCGAWFVTEVFLRAHGRQAHPDIDDPSRRLQHEIEELRREDQELSKAPPIKIGPMPEVRTEKP